MNASEYRKQRDEARAACAELADALNHALSFAVIAKEHGAGTCAVCAAAEKLVVKYHPAFAGSQEARVMLTTPTPDPTQPELFEQKEHSHVGS